MLKYNRIYKIINKLHIYIYTLKHRKLRETVRSPILVCIQSIQTIVY